MGVITESGQRRAQSDLDPTCPPHCHHCTSLPHCNRKKKRPARCGPIQPGFIPLSEIRSVHQAAVVDDASHRPSVRFSIGATKVNVKITASL
jgi:hypothetical protein